MLNRRIEPATIAVIDSNRRAGEREAFGRRNAHLGAVRRIAAVAGASADRGALRARGIIADGLGYSDGALFSALAHIALWREVVSRNQALTVCEDEAVCAEDFIAVADARLAALPPGWDIVLWGWNFDSSLVFQVLPGKPAFLVQGDGALGPEHLAGAPATAQLFRLERACGTLCYTVSPAGAARLLAHCLPLRDLALNVPEAGATWPNRGLDMMMSTLYPRLQAYVSVPPLAIAPSPATSTNRYAAAINLLGPVAGLSLVSLVGELDRQGTRADPMAEAAVYQAWIDANATSDLLFAAWFNMGSALARVGDKGNALTAYQKAIVLNPHFHPAEQMRRRLAG